MAKKTGAFHQDYGINGTLVTVCVSCICFVSDGLSNVYAFHNAAFFACSLCGSLGESLEVITKELDDCQENNLAAFLLPHWLQDSFLQQPQG